MHIFSDIYEYSIHENKWKYIKCHVSMPEQSTGGVADGFVVLNEPKLRFAHTAVVRENLMYVFGGWDGNITLNDLNVFDFERNRWLGLTNVKG